MLVVAADDGVMPQTVEAINHAKAAGVPIIVAINKIDKPGADPNRVRTDLLQHEIVVESMSGETLDVEVSALKRTGIDKLLEAISLQAELLDLRANPDRSAEGVVIEAKLERGRGPVGTVLVQRGTLQRRRHRRRRCGLGARARPDRRYAAQTVAAAGPSVPVEVLGFDSAPEAGDPFAVVESDSRAREITDYRVRKRRQTLGSAGTRAHARADDAAAQGDGPQGVPARRQGRRAGLGRGHRRGAAQARHRRGRGAHRAFGRRRHHRIRRGAGQRLRARWWWASTSAPTRRPSCAADQIGVEIRYYNIIYDLVDDVKKAMSGLLAPTLREIFLGNAEILEVFNISKVGKVAGCRVTDGKVERGAKVRLIRDNVVIHEGTLSTLKRFKDEVREVPAGQECGMAFANYQDIRAGDVIECFNIETIARSL